MASVAPARAAAFDILLKVGQGAGHCDELLRSDRVDRLSPQDRNLCTTLVMGTVRWQIALDAQLNARLARPDSKVDDTARLALRLGAFQLLHLDRIPAHAAISESVELAKRDSQFAAGMVNAILRKIAAAPREPIPESFADAASLAVAYAHPEWMVDRWVRRYGIMRATAICRSNQEQPPVTLRLTGPETEAELTAAEIELSPGAFLSHARRVLHGTVTGTDTYRSGNARIQDEGSQLVAELAGRGDTILDCCAAPGGKTAILAERNPGSAVLACDVSKRRLDEMRGLLRDVRGARFSYESVDAAKLRYDRQFDLALCDVPCSGTGTIARNPEIRHRLEPMEFARQHSRQVAILLAGMRAVKPGGRLVYATCSLEPEENESVVQDCLSGRSEYRQFAMEERLEALAAEGIVHESGAALLRSSAFENGFLRTLPGIHPCDGFFAAHIAREA